MLRDKTLMTHLPDAGGAVIYPENSELIIYFDLEIFVQYLYI
jgi:hypothetical protein